MRILSRIALSLLTAGALVAPAATVPASAVAPTSAARYDGTTWTPEYARMKSGTQLAAISDQSRTFTLHRVTATGLVSVGNHSLSEFPTLITVGTLTENTQPINDPHLNRPTNYYLAPFGTLGSTPPTTARPDVLRIFAV